MKIGTVVLCQMEIKPENGEPTIILGTFGIITNTWGIDGYEVQFADHTEPLSVSGKHITPLGNDNWNDHVLRKEYECRTLRKALAPFAKAFENVTELDDDDDIVDTTMQDRYKVGSITAGDLIRAKFALDYNK